MSEFPQYRKLSNLRSYYRIDDERHFTEIQLIGSKAFLLNFQATQYPEILKIKEMLSCTEPYLLSQKEEYEKYKELNSGR
jgi:hypothetical protein